MTRVDGSGFGDAKNEVLNRVSYGDFIYIRL